MKKITSIEEIPVFAHAASATLRELKRLGEIRTYPRGTTLFHAAQCPERAFFMMSGQAIIYNLTHEGNRKIIFVFGPGHMLNDNISQVNYTGVFAELYQDSRIYSISLGDLKELMHKDMDLCMAILACQERKLWRTSHQLRNTQGSINMERKLAAKLWKLGRDFGLPTDEGEIRIDMPLSITVLADLLGTARETTSRMCKSLIQRNLIRVDQKNIYLRDPEELARFYKRQSQGNPSEIEKTIQSL